MTAQLEPLVSGFMDDRSAKALERIATALEVLVGEYIEAKGPNRSNGQHELPVEPDYVRPLPPDLVAQPATAVVMGPPAFQRAARPPADPNQPPQRPCPQHGWTWKFVPAGHSNKTGNDYVAFWACNVRGCDQRPA